MIKKSILTLISLLMVFSIIVALPVSAAKSESLIYGDSTKDGVVNILDLVRTKKFLSGLTSDIDITNTDFTLDGMIRSDDISVLKKYLLTDTYSLDTDWDKYSVSYIDELNKKYATEGNDGATTVFIGDSFLDVRDWWIEFSKDLSGKDAIGAGITRSTSNDWSNYIARDLIFNGASPKNIIINIGVNDICTDKLSADECVASIEGLCNLIHKKMPDTNVYYYSICKRTDTTDYNNTIAQTNSALKGFTESKNWITFVDVADDVTEYKDGVHPTNALYSTVFIKKLLLSGCVIDDILFDNNTSSDSYGLMF